MNTTKNIYCISGLGADYRLFQNLRLPQEYRLRHLPWISPDKEESIESYAARIAAGIDEEAPVLVGVSFGGMISVEISKQMPVSRVILISSIKSKSEKPLYFRAAATLRLNKILPLKPYGFLEPIQNYNLGIENEEEKALAEEYRRTINLSYTEWAIDRILNWQNETFPDDIIHIHGSSDHIFPVRYVKPTDIIEGAGHMMVMNRAEEISAILDKAL